MLTSYLNLTSQLLQNPAAPNTLYSTANLTNYINIARGQVAGESRCIRQLATLATVIGKQAYNFSSITTGQASIAGIINVRSVMYSVGTGQKWIKGKSWEWFQLYRLNNPVPPSGAPTEWAQFGQGSSGQNSITGVGAGTMLSGSLYISPLPDIVYNLLVDCACYPQALAADADTEALPYYWTDAVPYFAAYMALMASQTSARIQQAQQLLQLYTMFMQRARDFANPDVNTFAFEQSQDIARFNRFGIAPKQQGGSDATQ